MNLTLYVNQEEVLSMKTKKFDRYLDMQCYRYAPEQFKAFLITGFSDINRCHPIYREIKLSYEETQRCGNTLICQGREGALAELKRILRARIRNKSCFYTIGFMSRQGNDYAFFRELSFKRDNQQEALYVYKEVKEHFSKLDWKIKQSSEVKLDRYYRPILESLSENYMEINPEKPVLIRLRYV